MSTNKTNDAQMPEPTAMQTQASEGAANASVCQQPQPQTQLQAAQAAKEVNTAKAAKAAKAAESVTTADKVAWSTIVLLGMLAAFGPICTDIYLPAVPTITAELQTDVSTMQLSLTAAFLGLALGQLFIGPLSDAYGRKVPLYISLVVFAISSVGCAMAMTAPQLIVARLFQGLAGAGGIVLSRTIACDLCSGAKLAQFMALLMTVNSLAPIFGPILGSAIITFFPWPVLFFFLAAWGMLLFLGSMTSLKETLPVEKRSPHLSTTIKGMCLELINMRFLLMALSMSFIMGAFFGYLASSPFIFQRIFGLSPFMYSVIFGVCALFITIAANIAGRLVRRCSEVSVVIGSLIIQFIATICLIAVIVFDIKSVVLVSVIFCFYVAMIGSSQTAGFGLVMNARAGGAGAASGIFGVLTFIFGAICSPLVGLMGEQSMVPQAACMLVCTICSFICCKFAMQLKTRHDVEVSLDAPEGHAGDMQTRPAAPGHHLGSHEPQQKSATAADAAANATANE